MARLVTHMHDFARETRLSSAEWMAAIEFLIGCGKICSDVRNVCFCFFSLFGFYPWFWGVIFPPVGWLVTDGRWC
jgi:hypothetical protein